MCVGPDSPDRGSRGVGAGRPPRPRRAVLSPNPARRLRRQRPAPTGEGRVGHGLERPLRGCGRRARSAPGPSSGHAQDAADAGGYPGTPERPQARHGAANAIAERGSPSRAEGSRGVDRALRKRPPSSGRLGVPPALGWRVSLTADLPARWGGGSAHPTAEEEQSGAAEYWIGRMASLRSVTLHFAPGAARQALVGAAHPSTRTARAESGRCIGSHGRGPWAAGARIGAEARPTAQRACRFRKAERRRRRSASTEFSFSNQVSGRLGGH